MLFNTLMSVVLIWSLSHNHCNSFFVSWCCITNLCTIIRHKKKGHCTHIIFFRELFFAWKLSTTILSNWQWLVAIIVLWFLWLEKSSKYFSITFSKLGTFLSSSIKCFSNFFHRNLFPILLHVIDEMTIYHFMV